MMQPKIIALDGGLLEKGYRFTGAPIILWAPDALPEEPLQAFRGLADSNETEGLAALFEGETVLDPEVEAFRQVVEWIHAAGGSNCLVSRPWDAPGMAMVLMRMRVQDYFPRGVVTFPDRDPQFKRPGDPDPAPPPTDSAVRDRFLLLGTTREQLDLTREQVSQRVLAIGDDVETWFYRLEAPCVVVPNVDWLRTLQYYKRIAALAHALDRLGNGNMFEGARRMEADPAERPPVKFLRRSNP